jgi:hypothetical protein
LAILRGTTVSFPGHFSCEWLFVVFFLRALFTAWPLCAWPLLVSVRAGLGFLAAVVVWGLRFRSVRVRGLSEIYWTLSLLAAARCGCLEACMASCVFSSWCVICPRDGPRFLCFASLSDDCGSCPSWPLPLRGHSRPWLVREKVAGPDPTSAPGPTFPLVADLRQDRRFDFISYFPD